MDLSFFLELSKAARAVTLSGSVPVADNKAAPGAYDPVTAIDRAAEQALRLLIEARFPDDGIDGEEFGSTRPEARRRWSLDPVDGTRALICGLPSWTTLAALVEDGEPVAGMIDAPVLDELAVAAGGQILLITKAGRRHMRTSQCTSLDNARLATTDPYLFDERHLAGFNSLRRTARVTRYGLDALAYARLAAGHIDLVAEAGLQPHDWRALVPVVRGAGGVIGNWSGGLDMSAGEVVAASTQALFDAAIEVVQRQLQRG